MVERRLSLATKAMVLTVAALSLASCSKLGIGGDKAPTGQVVARLDGHEITTLEVNSELRGMNVPPSMSRADAEKIALGNIITRRLLTAESEKRGLDKKPDFLMQEQRMEEQLRVQALARDIAAKVVQPTRDEADKFIRDNPYMFQNREFLILDQIQFPRPDNVKELGLEEAKTMDQIEATLSANNIPFRRQPASLDTLGANPVFVKEVTAVLEKNPSELFMFASRPAGAPGPLILVNQVKETRNQPFTGDKAREFATNFLRNERIQNALKAEVDGLQKASANRITYQKGHEINLMQPVTPPKNEQTAAAGAGPHVPSASPSHGPELPGGAEDLKIDAAPGVAPPPAAIPAPAPAAKG